MRKWRSSIGIPAAFSIGICMAQVVMIYYECQLPETGISWFVIFDLSYSIVWQELFENDRNALVQALSTNPVFLKNKASDANMVVDYKDWQVPLGRRFR
ncbi:Tyrosine decarboxylase 1 [Vitis vinifera]|nr:Tyrosine decarboxylase 1 [Vitis vinifera]